MSLNRIAWLALGGACVLARFAAGDDASSSALVEIMARSELPDPGTSPYKDCLYAAELRLIQSDSPQLPARLLGTFPGFADRQLDPAADYRPGEWLQVTLLPFADMPEEYRSLQQVDDILDLTLPGYAVVSSRRAAKAAIAPAPSHSDPPRVDPPGQDQALPRAVAFPEEAYRRAADLQADLARWREQLARHGNDWAIWHADLEPVRQELRALAETSGGAPLVKDRLALDPARWDLDLRLDPDSPTYRSMLETFRMMQREFAALGADLVVMPFPPAWLITAPDFLAQPPPDGVLLPDRVRWMMDLLEQEIEVLDLLPRFQAQARPYPFFYHDDVGDEHPAIGALSEAATVLAARLARYRFSAERRAFGQRTAQYGDPERPALIETREPYPCRQILNEDGSPLELPEQSPVLLLGDSFLDTPQRYGCPHANLPHQLAYELGVAPSVFLRTGGAHQILKFMARWGRLGYFAGRRVVVFAFNERLLYHPTAVWDATPFREPARARETELRRFEAAAPLWHLRGLPALGALSIDPPVPPEYWGHGKVHFPSAPVVRQVALPDFAAPPGAALILRLTAYASGPAIIAATWNKEPFHEIRLVKDKQDFFIPLVSRSGPGKLGLQIPAGLPDLAFSEVELRHETPPASRPPNDQNRPDNPLANPGSSDRR